MRLQKVRVTHYKCVDDSTEFTLDDVTCLVGKNEAGKTAILRSLYKLNPINAADDKFDKQQDYPRKHLLDYEERHKGEDAVVVTTHWEISDIELAEVQKLVGAKGITSKDVSVTKGYGGGQRWTMSIDEKEAAAHVLKNSTLHEEEAASFKDADSVKTIRERIEKLGDKASERHRALLTHLKTHFKRETAYLAAIDTVELPKFLYFSNYDRMNGQVALEALINKRASNQRPTREEEVFIAFLGLVGLTVEELAKQNQFEPLIARLESASIKISREVFDYWTQNRHLKVQFRLDQAQAGDPPPFNSGHIMRTRVLNTHHDVTVGFDERSTGFVWFFSFLVLFSQVKKLYGDNIIILLDEPGLSLHAKAQADLLRYFEEKLRPHHQLVYSTHSPFMISADKLNCARTVEDLVVQKDGGVVEVLGTKVGDEVLSTDKETLFPLQSALGYEITQSLFVGKHTLLVEGPSDLLYLKILSDELRARKRTPLDPRWTICPAGGVDKVGAFLSLFGGNKLHVAMFIDYAKGQKKKVDDFRRSNLLNKGHVFTADSYAGQDEADTEDMLGRETYIDLVNKGYSLNGQSMDANKLNGTSPRIVLQVEEHFRTLPPEVDGFDHFRPAIYFLENRSALVKSLPKFDGALDRFERLFKDLNTLLPS